MYKHPIISIAIMIIQWILGKALTLQKTTLNYTLKANPNVVF